MSSRAFGKYIVPVSIAAAAIATVAAWRSVDVSSREAAQASHALEGLAPEIARLRAYEAVQEEFAAAIESRGGKAPDPAAMLADAGVPAPDQANVSDDDPVEGWKARRATFKWESIPTEAALSAVSALSTSTPPWRIERLVVEPLPNEGLSRLDMLAILPVPEASER